VTRGANSSRSLARYNGWENACEMHALTMVRMHLLRVVTVSYLLACVMSDKPSDVARSFKRDLQSTGEERASRKSRKEVEDHSLLSGLWSDNPAMPPFGAN
jgi:hypothetical protein